jgi:23S rRNA pseudouridine1911/1915/1917 synthase
MSRSPTPAPDPTHSRDPDPDATEGPDPEDLKLSTLRSRLKLSVKGDEDGMRLDHFLARRCTWRSRTKIEELIESGKVKLADRAARPSRKVRAGETVVVLLPRPKRELDLHASGGPRDLTILHEDRWLLAVDKPPDIPVHPGGRLLEDTVITRLHERFRVGDPSLVPEEQIVPKLCHRLDLETSGALLVAKSDEVAAEMGRQLRQRETVKEYLAIVHGVVRDDAFTIDAPLGDHPTSRVANRRAVVPGGSASRTGVTVERRFHDFTLVRLRLFTGRRHQLRCHLHHVGHPIVGDKVYGLDEEFFLAYYEERLDAAMLRDLKLPRQALHAARLVVAHPKTKAPLEVRSPLPADLAGFVGSIEGPVREAGGFP